MAQYWATTKAVVHTIGVIDSHNSAYCGRIKPLIRQFRNSRIVLPLQTDLTLYKKIILNIYSPMHTGHYHVNMFDIWAVMLRDIGSFNKEIRGHLKKNKKKQQRTNRNTNRQKKTTTTATRKQQKHSVVRWKSCCFYRDPVAVRIWTETVMINSYGSVSRWLTCHVWFKVSPIQTYYIRHVFIVITHGSAF